MDKRKRKSPVSPITVEIRDEIVRKTFQASVLSRAVAEAKFQREVKAYHRLESLRVDFVPRLLAEDEGALQIDIERVPAGRTVVQWLESAPHNSFDPVISQIISIDKFLYVNRINYLGASPKDILIDDDYRVFILDFEETYLDERFEEVLCERMFHDRLNLVKNQERCTFFLAALAGRRNEFHDFTRRKVMGAIVKRLLPSSR